MKVTVAKEEKNKVWISIEAKDEEVKKEVKKTYKRLASQVLVPGFRKGKAPPEVLKTRLGKEVVAQEALKDLLPLFYSKAVENLGLKPIAPPRFNVKDFEEERGLFFEAEVEVKPKVGLKGYKGVKVEKPSVEVTEEEVEKHLDSLRDRFAKLKVVERRPIQEGDFVVISFQGFYAGQQLQSASANDFMVEVGGGKFIQEFENNLLGANVGEVREFEVNFPPNYPASEVAGKSVKFKVIVKEIKEKELPDLNDDFAKQVGAFETLDDLKKIIRERLEEVKEKEAEGIVRREVLKKVVDAAEVELPETLIQKEIDEVLMDFSYQLGLQGYSINQYLEAAKKSMEDLRDELRPEAEVRLRNELVLEAIAEKEDISVSSEEVDEEISKLAKKTGRVKESLEKEIRERGHYELFKYDILLKKCLDFIVNNAKVVGGGSK
jgi:trigger factor